MIDVVLDTPRLKLRPWSGQDVEQLTSGLNDLDVAKWLAFVPHPYTTTHALEWIRRCQEIATADARPKAYEFAIERNTDRMLIGGVSLNKINWQHGTAGGGIWIANGFQGRGYGREAFQAKIRFAFADLGLTKLVNGYLDGNDASWSMQRKLGYRQVGEVPIRCMADGRQTIEHVTELAKGSWAESAPSRG